jgi:hypothetical protein
VWNTLIKEIQQPEMVILAETGSAGFVQAIYAANIYVTSTFWYHSL